MNETEPMHCAVAASRITFLDFQSPTKAGWMARSTQHVIWKTGLWGPLSNHDMRMDYVAMRMVRRVSSASLSDRQAREELRW